MNYEENIMHEHKGYVSDCDIIMNTEDGFVSEKISEYLSRNDIP